MDSSNPQTRLAAIMFTDIVGYTALMAESEEKGLRARQRHREPVRPLVEEHHETLFDETGCVRHACRGLPGRRGLVRLNTTGKGDT